jgi:hypothetical protein
MKQKGPERIERRRASVDMNLLSEGGSRPSIAKRGRGCLSFLTPGLLVGAGLVAHLSGLH